MSGMSQTCSSYNTWQHHKRMLLPLMLVLFLLVGVMIPTAHAADSRDRILPQLQRKAAAEPNKKFQVIVTHLNDAGGVERATKALGGRQLKSLPHNAVVLELPGSALTALSRNPKVQWVTEDAAVQLGCVECVDSLRLTQVYAGTVNAVQHWRSLTNLNGRTGKGIGIAIVDTGINSARGDFRDAAGNSRVIHSPIFASGSLKQEDGHGHGTHVAGIAGGNSWNRSDLTKQGKYIGVAPDATLIDVKVADDNGRSTLSDVVTAIDWVVTNRELYNIRVMNLSLVSSVAESYKTSILDAAVERAWFKGIFVVVSSGNTGLNTMYYPPANDPFVVSVGAAGTQGTMARSDDDMAPWSSYGTTQDGFSKPEVVAPGRMIGSPLASSTATLAKNFPERILDGDYIWMSGTSMAAPVVAGMAALAFEARPELTNDQLKWLLQQTATKLGSAAAPLPGQGAGLVDVNAVLNFGGEIQHANQNIPISEQLIGPDGALVYDAAASWSASAWKASSWSASAWSASAWKASAWSSSLYGASSDSATTDSATTDVTSLDIE